MEVDAKARVVQSIARPSITAAAELLVTFVRCFYWLEARLWASGAQVRLRGSAYLGTFPFFAGAARRGRRALQRRQNPRRRGQAPPLRIARKPSVSGQGSPLGLPPEYAPGALAQHSQARKWKRTGCNFREARAQWPGLNCGKPLRFCAPEIFFYLTGTCPP